MASRQKPPSVAMVMAMAQGPTSRATSGRPQPQPSLPSHLMFRSQTDRAMIDRATTRMPIGPLIRMDRPMPSQNSSLCQRTGFSPARVAI
ncbi:hypothetical protein D3C85_1005820 [compost metagenome]